jgi:hypothetical protein
VARTNPPEIPVEESENREAEDASLNHALFCEIVSSSIGVNCVSKLVVAALLGLPISNSALETFLKRWEEDQD